VSRMDNDKFLKQEVLHTAHLLAYNVSYFLVDHKYIENRPELLELAEKAMETLSNLYQAIGATNDNN